MRERICLLVFLALNLGRIPFFLLDLGSKLLVLLTLGVEVVHVKDVDDVLLLENELLDFSGDDCGNAPGLFALF